MNGPGRGGPGAKGDGPESGGIVEVVAGIVVEAGMVLVAQRHRDQSFPLLWEFPGGKVEPEEAQENALTREFQEELGITVRAVRPYDVIEYPGRDGRSIRVTFFLARRESGTPRPLQVESVAWVPTGELPRVDFIPHNREIVERLRTEFERGESGGEQGEG